MSNKRKNPYSNEQTTSPKKRKLNAADSYQWTITFTATQSASNAKPKYCIENESHFKCGRDPTSCSILFPSKNAMVSTNHCEFHYDPIEHKLWVKDLKSTNGVFVNGQHIDSNGIHELFDGDTIRFGKRFKSYNHEYRISIQHHDPNPNPDPNPNASNDSKQSMDIDSMVRAAINEEIAEHRKKMGAELAAKDEEMKDIKQQLHNQSIEEKTKRTQQQRETLEQQRAEIEAMRHEIERETARNAQKIEADRLEMEREKQRIEAMQQQKEEQEAMLKLKEQETKQKSVVLRTS